MSYQFNRQDVYALASAIGAETHEKGNELHFKYCPYCHGGEHRDKETFSINLEHGAFCCLRASCGAQGHFVEMAAYFNYPLDFGEQRTKKKYRRLPQAPIKVRDKAIEYMASRGISEAVCKAFNITTQSQHENVIVFPFYDQDGIMQTVKYRKADFVKGRDSSKEWFESETKPILFGMRQCKGFERLIICEGQLDSLSVIESGIFNAVSVPNGANGFTWVEHCFDWVNQFNEVVIFGDCENGKITLVDEFVKRFPRKKTLIVRQIDYLGEKDANDILRKYGKEAIKACIERAELRKVEAVISLSSVKKIDLEKMPSIKSGIYELDKVTGGFYFGTVTLLTGKRGDGKSTLASNIFKSALEQEYSCFAYSGELPAYHFKEWLDRQIAGDRCNEGKNDWQEPIFWVSDADSETIGNWYADRAFVYDNSAVIEQLSENEKVDENLTLLNAMQIAVCQYGIKFVMLDNLMTALDVEPNDDLYRAQSAFVKRLKRIAQRLDIAVLLIAHPRKEGKGTELDSDSVSGAADITNAVDTVITYSSSDKQSGISLIGVTKNRLTGKKATGEHRICVKYDAKSKRICGDKDDLHKISACFNPKSKIPEEMPLF